VSEQKVLPLRFNLEVEFERTFWDRYSAIPRNRRMEFVRACLRAGLNALDKNQGLAHDGEFGAAVPTPVTPAAAAPGPSAHAPVKTAPPAPSPAPAPTSNVGKPAKQLLSGVFGENPLDDVPVTQPSKGRANQAKPNAAAA